MIQIWRERNKRDEQSVVAEIQRYFELAMVAKAKVEAEIKRLEALRRTWVYGDLDADVAWIRGAATRQRNVELARKWIREKSLDLSGVNWRDETQVKGLKVETGLKAFVRLHNIQTADVKKQTLINAINVWVADQPFDVGNMGSAVRT